jgi:hypothetical protein
MAMTSDIKKAFMANNDDNTKNSKDYRNGLPAAIFATTGRPELIKEGAKRNDFLFEIERHESN